MSIVQRAALVAAVTLVLSGCNVTDGDIEHWKHTQRGPRKITTVLVEGRYDQAMRVHAARALIEMKHPNASGLDLLHSAFQSIAPQDREPIIHALVPELRSMMGSHGTASAQGPTEQQIKAKDAAYIILRGDGHSSFASAEDRATLATMVLDWVLEDFNTRALAGAYTAEQIVQAIGPSSVDRLNQSIVFGESAIPVVVELAKLVNGIAPAAGKQSSTDRIAGVAREVEGSASDAQIRPIAVRLLGTAGRTPDEAAIVRAMGQIRTQYLTLLYEAIRTLGQPNGAEYLLTVAGNAATPLDRRKMALNAMAGSVTAAHTQRLLGIVTCGQGAAPVDPRRPPAPAAPGGNCDNDLRGLAVDRVGETHDRGVIPQLFGLFDTSNGVAADQSFTVRWKMGEAIIKLGGAAIIPDFVTHLGMPRSAPFAGYTFAELNGESQALGDITPPPREQMRGYLAASYPVPVRVLAMMFLGIKGERPDLAVLQPYVSEATPVTGEGWNDSQLQLTTVGAVATRARRQLEETLRQGETAPGGNR